MTKAELVKKLAEETGVARKSVAEVVDAFIATVEDSVVAGDRVMLPGFGVFERVDHEPRISRNPRTGERVEVPASSSPRFKVGSRFKRKVKG